MIYSLMYKNIPILGLNINQSGSIERISPNKHNAEFMPLAYQYQQDGIIKWWKERCLPQNQFVEKILQDNQVSCPEEYLLHNLGLSLTDHYWIKPADVDIQWEDVNLFKNDFKNELMLADKEHEQVQKTFSYTPNSSLQGNLEKSWNIINNDRVLVKGNHGEQSQEALNEVLATKLHEMQGFHNHTKYDLISIHNKSYKYGCFSKIFTSEDLFLVSAHELLSSQKQPNDL